MNATQNTAEVGTVVSYEDRANPRRNYIVIAKTDNQWSPFTLRATDDFEVTHSDLRQIGWQVVAE
jgi:hypothetical protein